MIVYDLQCQNGHTFEGWFEDAKAFNKQQKANLIACPVCNATQVARIPSTFAIKGSTAARKQGSYKNDANESLQLDDQKMTRAVTEFFEKNFDNVGADFATEALKMHYVLRRKG